MAEAEKRTDTGLAGQLSRVWRLSVPAILTQITSIVMQYIDSAMVGQSMGAGEYKLAKRYANIATAAHPIEGSSGSGGGGAAHRAAGRAVVCRVHRGVRGSVGGGGYAGAQYSQPPFLAIGMIGIL